MTLTVGCYPIGKIREKHAMAKVNITVQDDSRYESIQALTILFASSLLMAITDGFIFQLAIRNF
jgi:hypothetical protein